MASKAAQPTGKIRIRLKAFDHKVADQSAKQIADVAARTGAKVMGPIPLPTRRTLYSVTKSPHKYKESKEQFETKVHKRIIDVVDPTPQTMDKLMNLNVPAGCHVDIRMQ